MFGLRLKGFKTIGFDIDEKNFLCFLRCIGRVVSKLLDEEKLAGNYRVDFIAEGLASGIYSKKMILMQ